MRTFDDIKEVFNKLTNNMLHETIVNFTNLPSSGSSRKYFRITTKTRNVIGTYNPNIECGLPVPEDFAVNDAKDIYIQSDFGDNTLYNNVERCLKNGYYDDETVELYKKNA